MERESSDEWYNSVTKMIQYRIDKFKSPADPYLHWFSNTADKLLRFRNITTTRFLGMDGTDAFKSKERVSILFRILMASPLHM